MEKKPYYVVTISVSGDVAKVHPIFGGDVDNFHDLQWMPFRPPKGQSLFDSPREPVTVEVDHWFGSKRLFDQVKEDWYKGGDIRANLFDSSILGAYKVNVTLAILDHFGLDAEFDPEFIWTMRPYANYVMDYGYRTEYENDNIKTRKFRGQKMNPSDFKKMFREFFSKYDVRLTRT